MDASNTSRTGEPAVPRVRVWQDTAAESLLSAAVCLIALTGFDPFVVRLQNWLASIVRAYDPMATMLALMIVVVAGLIVGSIRLKMSARRSVEDVRLSRPVRRRPRLWGTFPYPGS